jgi:hypothetical protein
MFDAIPPTIRARLGSREAPPARIDDTRGVSFEYRLGAPRATGDEYIQIETTLSCDFMRTRSQA